VNLPLPPRKNITRWRKRESVVLDRERIHSGRRVGDSRLVKISSQGVGPKSAMGFAVVFGREIRPRNQNSPGAIAAGVLGS